MLISIRMMPVWPYLFLKLCDMSFKGPHILRGKLEEIEHTHGDVKTIPFENKSSLQDLLKKHIQPYVDKEDDDIFPISKISMRAFYQDHLDHLVFALNSATPHDFNPEYLEPYLGMVEEKWKNCRYLPEPMLKLMTVAMYNLEIRPDPAS